MAKTDSQEHIITQPPSTHVNPHHHAHELSSLDCSQSFELNTTSESGVASPPGARQDFSLPRADGGRDAWLVLAACFILEALVWGFPFAFGVFNEFYAKDPLFEKDKAILPAIGTTQTGIMYLGGALVYPFLRQYPRIRKPFSIFGFIIMLVGLIGASFANTASQLLATQGVMYGIGGCMHYFVAFLYLDEWFFARKGFAYGVVWAGAGAAGAALPLTLRWILSTWGFRTALRSWVVITMVLTTPAFFWLKGRLPIQHASRGPQRIELGFLRSTAFWIIGAGVLVQGLGHFLPSLYMPVFAQDVGLPAISGTVAISLSNTANVFGAMITGYLVDKFHVTTAINFCAVGTVIAVFLFWSFAVYTPVLYIFAFTYGLFSGGFASTWAGATNPLRQKWPAVDTGMVIALLAALKGIGSIVSGPMSGALLASAKWSAGYGWVDGYGSLIIFSGATAAATGSAWCFKKCGML